jgi:hypothetical protein
VKFVCIKGLRLVTMQLPEKSWPIGPGHGLSHESPLVSMILNESCEADLPTL